MSSLRLMAIGLIYLCTTVAWSTLGASVVGRTGESDAQLSKEVAQLWGGRHNQIAPQIRVLRPRLVTELVQETNSQGQPTKREVTKTVHDPVLVPLRTSRVEVGLNLQHRQKGLLWYDTYTVGFSGRYRLRNPTTSRAPSPRSSVSRPAKRCTTGSCSDSPDATRRKASPFHRP